jgi:hypothetical protein
MVYVKALMAPALIMLACVPTLVITSQLQSV